MKRIVVSVTNDLVTDQRVYKVCKSLQKLDFDILLIGRQLKNSPPINRPYKTYRMRLLFNKGILFYTEYSIRLFFKLLFTKKDILLSNDLDTLLPNYMISQLQKKKLVYDSHELFTEVPELIHRPKVQKIWIGIEEKILPKLKNCYTVCQSIADYYNNKYGTNFSVIRNLPEKTELTISKFPFNSDGKKIILYQGAINKGRGLELMINTMQHLDNYIFVIIGTGDILHELKEKVNDLKIDDKIKFLGRIEPNKLSELTPLADIGISIEEDLGLNYHYALPNKIFDYIHAEIPILVSDLPEMKNIIEKYNVGEIVENRNPKAFAKQLNNILGKKYFKELQLAKKELIWEKEEGELKIIYSYLS
ncbi:MAG: glycosyltransferase [Flavobacteriaceae bacterium]